MVDVLWRGLLFLTALYSRPTLLDIIVVQSYSLSTATPSSSNEHDNVHGSCDKTRQIVVDLLLQPLLLQHLHTVSYICN